MKPTNTDQIWATISHTINLGNFESAKIEIGQSITVKEGEDPISIRKELSTTLMQECIRKGKLFKLRYEKSK